MSKFSDVRTPRAHLGSYSGHGAGSEQPQRLDVAIAGSLESLAHVGPARSRLGGNGNRKMRPSDQKRAENVGTSEHALCTA